MKTFLIIIYSTYVLFLGINIGNEIKATEKYSIDELSFKILYCLLWPIYVFSKYLSQLSKYLESKRSKSV